MFHYHGRLNLYHWLAVSLLLHSIVALPFFYLVGLHKADRVRHHKLAIELFGMVSNRQVEGKKKGTEVPRPNKRPPLPSVAPRPAARQSPRQSPDTYTTVAADGPVRVEKGDDEASRTDQETGPASATGSADVDQRQQSIGYGGEGADVITQYLARVAKRVQTNLVYPEETRKHGVEGVPTVSFTITESGAIREGSLRVRKSCGQASLDSNALKSVLASAPFEKPPKELKVSIDVRFSVEMARPRTTRASAQ